MHEVDAYKDLSHIFVVFFLANNLEIAQVDESLRKLCHYEQDALQHYYPLDTLVLMLYLFGIPHWCFLYLA